MLKYLLRLGVALSATVNVATSDASTIDNNIGVPGCMITGPVASDVAFIQTNVSPVAPSTATAAINTAHATSNEAMIFFTQQSVNSSSPAISNVSYSAQLYNIAVPFHTQTYSYTFHEIPITNAAPVPGPGVGTGLPGIVLALSGLIAWLRRRRSSAV